MIEQAAGITKAELARHLHRSKAAVSKYCRAGLPVRPDGRVDWLAAQAWVEANVLSERSGSFAHDERIRAAKSAAGSAKGKPAKSAARTARGGKAAAGKPVAGTIGAAKADPLTKRAGLAAGPGPGETIAALQRAKLRVEIETRQLSLLRERCLVVPLAAVNAHFAAVITQVRNRLLHLPAQLADRFGVLDGAECAALLDSELRVILSSLSKYQPPERPEDRTTGQADTAEAQ